MRGGAGEAETLSHVWDGGAAAAELFKPAIDGSKFWLVQQGPAEFQFIYGETGCTEVDLSSDLCTTSLLGFFFLLDQCL